MTSLRVLVWTRSGPEQPSGSPAILAEYLQCLPTGSVRIVCEGGGQGARRRESGLAHTVTYIAPERTLWPFRRAGRIRAALRYLLLPIYVLIGAWHVIRWRPGCILTVYFDVVWVLSGYLIARFTGVPILFYAHDPLLEPAEHRGGTEARIARWVEPRCLRHGSLAVLYPSLERHYRERYGVAPIVIRHLASGQRRPRLKRPRGRLRVGFAGSVYDNNRKLMSQLAAACAANPDIELRLYTNASESTLQRLGFAAERVTIAFEASHNALIDRLAECDLLYLPLAFTASPELPRVSLEVVLPTKAVDYLLAGPPILVHCPAEYETARFFAEREAAHHLGIDATGALDQWLRRWLAGDVPEIDEAAMRRALDEFSPDTNIERFRATLRSIAGRSVTT